MSSVFIYDFNAHLYLWVVNNHQYSPHEVAWISWSPVEAPTRAKKKLYDLVTPNDEVKHIAITLLERIRYESKAPCVLLNKKQKNPKFKLPPADILFH